MINIEVEKARNVYGSDTFLYDENGYRTFPHQLDNIPCDVCGNVYLDNEYVKIIKQLKKAGLLEKYYLYVCCACFGKRKRKLW